MSVFLLHLSILLQMGRILMNIYLESKTLPEKDAAHLYKNI